MNETLLLTILLGIGSIAITRLLNRAWVSASLAYWGAWVFVLACYAYSETQAVTAQSFGRVPIASEGTFELIRQAHWGAFIGFLIGSLLGGRIPRSASAAQRFIAMEVLLRRHFKHAIALLFMIGLVQLIERLFMVGVNLPTLYLDIRLSYLTNSLTPFGRVASYLTTASPVLAIMLGMSDASSRVRFRRLLLLTIAVAPFGLSMGGRGFLLGILLPYGASFLLFYELTPSRRRLIRLVSRVVLYISCAVLVFAAIGEWRYGSTTRADAQEETFVERSVDQFVSYFAVSIPAVEPVATTLASQVPLGLGRDLFEWPTLQLERIGLLQGSRSSELASLKPMLVKEYGILAFAPPTLIPLLVGDFGFSFMPFYMAILMALCQVATIRLRGTRLLGQVIGTLALLAALQTVQTNAFLQAGNSLAILWTLLIATVIQRLKKQLRSANGWSASGPVARRSPSQARLPESTTQVS